MIANKSPLKYVQFYLLNSVYEFIDGDIEVYEDLQNLFEKYEIEVDFVSNQRENNEFSLFTRITINHNKAKLPGHSLMVEGTGIFELEKDNLEEEVINNLSTLSAVTMMISSIRGYIMNLTGYSPMGKFVIPSLDITGVINQKNEKKRRQRKKNIVE